VPRLRWNGNAGSVRTMGDCYKTSESGTWFWFVLTFGAITGATICTASFSIWLGAAIATGALLGFALGFALWLAFVIGLGL